MSAPPIIPSHAPLPKPRRRDRMPLFVILGALALCVVFGVVYGVFFVNQLRSQPKPAPEIPPKVIKKHEDGWVCVQLDTIGLTLDMPTKPSREESNKEGKSALSTYNSFASYAATNLHDSVYVFAYTNKFRGLMELGEDANDYIDQYREDPDVRNFRSEILDETVDGKQAKKIEMQYDHMTDKFFVKVMIFNDGAVTYMIQIFGDTDPEEAYRRVRSSARVHDSDSPLAQAKS